MPPDLPIARSVAVNPSQAALREWTRTLMPRVTKTEFGNLNYQTRITSRLKRSTFFVSDVPTGQQTIDRATAAAQAARQDAHIAEQDMILLEGSIGADPDHRHACRLFIERSNANIAGMQDQLYFPPVAPEDAPFTVIYTPGLAAPGYPDECLIMVDLASRTTRVLGSDYFGESKMGGLRMWNAMVYEQGGLGLHAGCKVFPAESTPDGREHLALVIGLSGTGKTTTTFRQQLGSLPVQDDFLGLYPGGVVRATEAGCFAKTYGLDAGDEPTIHAGTTSPDAWLENVGVDPATGRVDFWDATHTENGRSTFPLDGIRHRDPRDLPRATYLFVLNRNDGVIPAVARLDHLQAAAYFMLGETMGTSAGGAAEEGRSLRVPGTNPFFHADDAQQGNRIRQLLLTMPDLQVFLMNTGWVGGAEGDEHARKVRIDDSSAIIQGIVQGTITWQVDDDFGYEVAALVPGVDRELLVPRELYRRQRREDVYERRLARLRDERQAYFDAYPALDPEIVKAARLEG